MTRPKSPAKPIQQVLDLLEGVRRGGNGWSALCPSHSDTESSLSIAEGDDGRVLVKCFTGCETEEIVDALGLQMRDLFPQATTVEKGDASITTGPANKKVVTTYDYGDETGRMLYQVVRYSPKDFRPRRPDPNGGFIYDLKGVRRVLYNLADVLTATHVIVTEGEKDAERVKKALRNFKKREGVRWTVTTVAGGAQGWRSEYAPYLTGKCVFILPDNDETGQKFAENAARSISSFARRVKIVQLPGLPEKGDVSDYLDEHYARELRQELRRANLYQRAGIKFTGTSGGSFEPQLLREYFDAPDEQQKWTVDGLLPAGGMSLLAGKPKAGKSTLARQLSLSVATGSQFLGRETEQGEVLYLALEEKRQEVKEHFRDLGASGDEPIRIHCATAPVAAMKEARVLLNLYQPSLCIIDPLFKFTRVKDGNDYAGMTAALEPILAAARETGTHIMAVHHAGKAERSDPTDAILGSTAILGNVDSALLLTRYDDYRTISSRQRYGDDLPETVLDFNPVRRSTTLGIPRAAAEQAKVEQEIVEFLQLNPGAYEAEILGAVAARRQRKISALRALLGTRIRRQGKGGKADPYRYVAISGSEDSDVISGTTTGTTARTASFQGKIAVPDVPRIKTISGNKNGAVNLDLGNSGSMSRAPGTRTRRQKRKRVQWRGVLEQAQPTLN
jgi:hypothetical protein